MSNVILTRQSDGARVDLSGAWSRPRPIKRWAAAFGVSTRTLYRRLDRLDTRREFGGLCLRLKDCPPSIIADDLGLKLCQTVPFERKYNRLGG